MRRLRKGRPRGRVPVTSPRAAPVEPSPPGAPVATLARARRLGHRVDRLAAVPVRSQAPGSSVQPVRHRYGSRADGLVPDLEIDTDKEGEIRLWSPTNEKVRGSLTYRIDKGSTTLKVVQAFPQGYGLGTVLLHYLGRIAHQAGSPRIEIGAPALTEIGFYQRMGASFTTTEATSVMQEKLLGTPESREDAWLTLLHDAAQKAWDSGSGGYFEGKTEKRFIDLPGEQQEAFKEAKAYELRSSKETMIDAYLKNRGAYMTSPTGLRFEHLPKLIELSGTSLEKRWKRLG